MLCPECGPPLCLPTSHLVSDTNIDDCKCNTGSGITQMFLSLEQIQYYMANTHTSARSSPNKTHWSVTLSLISSLECAFKCCNTEARWACTADTDPNLTGRYLLAAALPMPPSGAQLPLLTRTCASSQPARSRRQSEPTMICGEGWRGG